MNRLFEGNLPPSVVDLPRDLPDKGHDDDDDDDDDDDADGAAGTRKGKSKRSVFDGDKFDIMSGAVLDPSRVQRGKRFVCLRGREGAWAQYNVHAHTCTHT